MNSWRQFSWAWPQGAHDLLLRAAGLPDEVRALQSYRTWLEAADFEAITYREQRLLVAIAARHGDVLRSGEERARLKGIERMLWAQSQAALAACRPALRALQQADIPVMVFKGAARATVDPSGLRGRVANDVDLLVRPRHFVEAAARLQTQGWQADHFPGRRVTGINLERGRFGRVDLHRYAFHQLLLSDRGGGEIWERASPVRLLDCEVAVPSATDCVALAIAHGGIDGHNHSDWLLDCAFWVRSGNVDWPLLRSILVARRLEAHAAIAFSYLRERLETEMPDQFIADLVHRLRRSPLRKWSALLQGRPKFLHSPLSNALRGIFRGARQIDRGVKLFLLERA